MILKVLDQERSSDGKAMLDVWNYFDNITSASQFFHEGSQSVVVRCSFKDGNIVTIDIPYVAYLMSDAGKTIERIYNGKEVEKLDDVIHPTLLDAVEEARERA